MSQRTKHMRLGHGIVQTPPPFNHPARVAERIATLDLVSGGRVDFGTGESSSEAELGGFLIDPIEKREMWEEGLRVALRCMTEEPFTGSHGKYVTMPPRNVVPEAAPEAAPAGLGGVQPARHDPPRGAEGDRRAERSRSSTPKRPATGSATTTRRSQREGVPIGDAVNAEPRVRHDVHVPPRRGRGARSAASKGANFFGYSLAHYYVFGRHQPGATDVWAEYQQRRAEHGFDPSAVHAAGANDDRLGAKVVQDGLGGLRGAVGTPDQVREYLRRYEECGVDQVIFVSQSGKNRTSTSWRASSCSAARCCPSSTTATRRPSSDKAQRLAPVIEQVMARKPADGPPAAADRRLRLPGDPAAIADRVGLRRLPQVARPGRRGHRGRRQLRHHERAALTQVGEPRNARRYA